MFLVNTGFLLVLLLIFPVPMQAAQSFDKAMKVAELNDSDRSLGGGGYNSVNKIDLAYLNRDTFLYHYYAFSDKDEGRVEKIAREYFSKEFVGKNEFDQQRALKKLKPLILEKISEAASHETVTISYSTDLYRYDFEQKAFRYPVPIRASFERDLFNKSTGRYVVEYAYHKGEDWLYMDEQQAEAFFRKNGKRITLLLTVKIKPEGKLRFSGEIQSYQVLAANMELLDTVTLSGR